MDTTEGKDKGKRFFKDDYDIMRAIISSQATIRRIEKVNLVAGTYQVRASQRFYKNSILVYWDGVRKFEGSDYNVKDDYTLEFLTNPSTAVIYLDYVTPDQNLEL